MRGLNLKLSNYDTASLVPRPQCCPFLSGEKVKVTSKSVTVHQPLQIWLLLYLIGMQNILQLQQRRPLESKANLYSVDTMLVFYFL